MENAIPARVVELHRSIIVVQTEDKRLTLPVIPDMTGITVGDWLLDTPGMREQSLNSATLAQKRAWDKSLSRLYRSVQGESRRRKKG
ncbi:hypothetical protein NX722_02095 [Endozoicomonas gorgoniicola]|uniref:Uncharacterized protein n=1 Tax=Endozoicomonas gorgoniicola TaxID=1234144 RepID=A0ABT3MPZ8_9GAMM|nr:hypothetical protein [Endozoicomonas gorgoniicola]MCW7551450.1 hypothetical protein [Endozoicomonas gorgoniicola]